MSASSLWDSPDSSSVPASRQIGQVRSGSRRRDSDFGATSGPRSFLEQITGTYRHPERVPRSGKEVTRKHSFLEPSGAVPGATQTMMGELAVNDLIPNVHTQSVAASRAVCLAKYSLPMSESNSSRYGTFRVWKRLSAAAIMRHTPFCQRCRHWPRPTRRCSPGRRHR